MAVIGLALLCGMAAAWKAQCPTYWTLAIPAAQPGKFNIAMVMSAKASDDPWSQSHLDGLSYLQKDITEAHVVYLESIPEFCDSQRVFEGLARQGYALVLGTAFGYQDSMERAAAEFPEVTFIHVLGLKANKLNFDSLSGALEDMVYLSGMLAGAQASSNATPRLGFIATLPIPEEFRMINAAALGMTRTCPKCKMDVRWLNSWQDHAAEMKLATDLYDAGAQIVFSGASGTGLLDASQARGRSAVTIGSAEACKAEPTCLTAAYWRWGPVYESIARKVQAGAYRPTAAYFHADSGGLGLLGFMPGEQLSEAAAGLPPEMLDAVRGLLERMQDPGQQAWLEVFAGPIVDNQNRLIAADGAYLTRLDTDQFPPGAPDEVCQPYCMYWYASGITASLPDIGKASR